MCTMNKLAAWAPNYSYYRMPGEGKLPENHLAINSITTLTVPLYSPPPPFTTDLVWFTTLVYPVSV
jgi:hypothetical protein